MRQRGDRCAGHLDIAAAAAAAAAAVMEVKSNLLRGVADIPGRIRVLRSGALREMRRDELLLQLRRR